MARSRPVVVLFCSPLFPLKHGPHMLLLLSDQPGDRGYFKKWNKIQTAEETGFVRVALWRNCFLYVRLQPALHNDNRARFHFFTVSRNELRNNKEEIALLMKLLQRYLQVKTHTYRWTQFEPYVPDISIGKLMDIAYNFGLKYVFVLVLICSVCVYSKLFKCST